MSYLFTTRFCHQASSIFCNVFSLKIYCFSTQCHTTQNRTGKSRSENLGRINNRQLMVFKNHFPMYSLCFLVWGLEVLFFHLKNYRDESLLCVLRKRGGQSLTNLVSAGSQLRWTALPRALVLAKCDSILLAFFPPFLHFFVGSVALNFRIPSSLILRSSLLHSHLGHFHLLL